MSLKSSVTLGMFSLLLLFGASASANSQFNGMSADAKYVVVGVVTGINAIPKQKPSKATFTDAFEAGARGSDDYYSLAQVAIERVVEGDGGKAVQSKSAIRVCTAQGLIAGASYLFFLGDGKNSAQHCLQATAFLLGTVPGQDKVAAVAITEDVLLLIPEKLTMYEDGVALPSATFVKAMCPNNLAVLKTYVKLDDFLQLVRKARADR